MQIFQGIIFTWIRMYREIFRSALVYLQVMQTKNWKLYQSLLFANNY